MTKNKSKKAKEGKKASIKGQKRKSNPSPIQCTEVRVFPVKLKKSLKTLANASVVINNSICLTGLKVIDGVNGYFVSYPIDPNGKTDDYRSLYYPIDRATREHIENVIVDKYLEMAGLK